eukprot:184015_1
MDPTSSNLGKVPINQNFACNRCILISVFLFVLIFQVIFYMDSSLLDLKFQSSLLGFKTQANLQLSQHENHTIHPIIDNYIPINTTNITSVPLYNTYNTTTTLDTFPAIKPRHCIRHTLNYSELAKEYESKNISYIINKFDKDTEGHWDRKHAVDVSMNIHNLTDNFYLELKAIFDFIPTLKSWKANHNNLLYLQWISNNSYCIDLAPINISIESSIVDCIWNKSFTIWGDSVTHGIVDFFHRFIFPIHNIVYNDTIHFMYNRTDIYFDTLRPHFTEKLYAENKVKNSNMTFYTVPHMPGYHHGNLIFLPNKLEIIKNYIHNNLSINVCNGKENLVGRVGNVDLVFEVFCNIENYNSLLKQVKAIVAERIIKSDYLILNSLLHDNAFWSNEYSKIIPNKVDKQILKDVFGIDYNKIYPVELMEVIKFIKQINKNIKIIYWNQFIPYYANAKNNHPGMPDMWWTLSNLFLYETIKIQDTDIFRDVRYIDTRHYYKSIRDLMGKDVFHSHLTHSGAFPWIYIHSLKHIFHDICET